MTLDLSPADFERLTTCPTTGLLVRAVGEILIGRRRTDLVGVVMIDLDGLKPVNDRFGHAAGDALLRLAAEIVRHTVAEEDIVIRWGGDEIVVVLADAYQPEATVPRLVDALDGRWGVRASVGLGTGAADDAIRRADEAMYGAKKARR